MASAPPLSTEAYLRRFIRDIPDFPVAGIIFKDITPLLADQEAYSVAIRESVTRWHNTAVDLVVAIESRGFVLGAPLAHALSAGLVLVRKPGKLPGEKDRFPYTCEYCSGTLEVHKGSIAQRKRCLIVDDLLATGGTASATASYIRSLGANIVGYGFLVELGFLNGRSVLQEGPVHSVISY